MNKDTQKRKLVGPWGKLHAAVWAIGLVILALRDWWWPGILVLVAISLVLEAALTKFAPQAFAAVEPPAPPAPPPAAPASGAAAPVPPAVAASEHRVDLLPTVCPKCGGPTRGHEVRWTGPQSADCPYCGANLPMKRS